jgi:hypothetical protein
MPGEGSCFTAGQLAFPQVGSRTAMPQHITLGTKQTDAPSAGNPDAGCDVAGTGTDYGLAI